VLFRAANMLRIHAVVSAIRFPYPRFQQPGFPPFPPFHDLKGVPQRRFSKAFLRTHRHEAAGAVRVRLAVPAVRRLARRGAADRGRAAGAGRVSVNKSVESERGVRAWSQSVE
jgi:hypothetical protein